MAKILAAVAGILIFVFSLGMVIIAALVPKRVFARTYVRGKPFDGTLDEAMDEITKDDPIASKDT